MVQYGGGGLPHYSEEKPAVVHYFVVIEELNSVYILWYCFFKCHIWKCCSMVPHKKQKHLH